MAKDKKAFWNEFKEFAARGNVIDMAVGIAVGAAFAGIAQSLVNDILMPPLDRARRGELRLEPGEEAS